MSRNRNRKVLYEVSNEAKKARKSGTKLEIARRARAFKKKITAGRAVDIKEKTVIKPVGVKRNILLILGRIFSFPVKKALIVLVIFAGVVIFWPSAGNETPKVPGGDIKVETPIEMTGTGGNIDTGEPIIVDNSVGPVIPGPPKDHCIVIASHSDLDQLKALAGHFALEGIATELKGSGNRHTLISKDRYISPGPQSGLKQAKIKIEEIGNKYKPQSGYLRFKFNDIYEKKAQ
jgi:hypothetical protein